MYIARRTGGGRGVYEIAGQTKGGYSARDVIGRNLLARISPYVDFSFGIRATIQGGKPRLVLIDPSSIHIQRQIASILLLPKPIRAASGLGKNLPSPRTNTYAIERLEMEEVELPPNQLVFRPGLLQLIDQNGNLQIPFLGRFGQVATLWSNIDGLPKRLSQLLAQHEKTVLRGKPLDARAEQLVKSIQSELASLLRAEGHTVSEDSDPIGLAEQLFPGISIQAQVDEIPLAEEIQDRETPLFEGSKRTITVNAYERNPSARKQSIAIHGLNCSVCGMNFLNEYGEIGQDFIHVHHLVPLRELGDKYQIDPKKDLLPVCPNCHAMLHKRTPPYGIQELKEIIRKHQRNPDE